MWYYESNREGDDRILKTVTLEIEAYLYTFYERVGKQAGGIAAEQVMADALFQFAGRLSLDAIQKETEQA